MALPGLPPSAKPQTIQRYNTNQGLPLRRKLLNAFYGLDKSHPFRQYTVLPCSPPFGRSNEMNVLSGRVYLLAHLRSPELRALTVAFAVDLADGFSERALAGKLKPLDVARLVTPGKYPDGDGLYLVVAGSASRN
jgi:hypothetical protein